MVTRGGLLNYLNWCVRAYRVADGSGAPVHSPLSFDLTVTSLFPPLVAGRSVRLLGDDEAAGELLAEALRGRPDFSLIKITPAHLEMLGLLMKPDEIEGAARALVVGGEVLHAESLSFWRAHAPATRLINEYGPTETVVGCCVYEAQAAMPSGPVPIGLPIANTQVYVLDERMNPTPFFAAGEIYIGGAGVARGYLNRPDATAARFVPDPFSGAAGARLYRTGDLGRRRADGTLEFLGRNDYQVKIKGYRIELGEVEAALRELPEVREAVVAARAESGEKRLVAYVALRDSAEPSGGALQRGMQEKLPDYMIPSALVFLSRLPLTRNGKVDRDALPAPDPSRPDLDKSYAPPRTPAEKTLAELWAKALGLERVGIHDNFFELGGDSILSIQIANRANAAGLRLTPRQIFQNHTIAELAALAGPAREAGDDEAAEVGPVPLTPIQQWFFEQNLPEPHHWNQSLMLEVRRPLDPSVVEMALRRLVAHHDALRLRFAPSPGGWRQHRLSPGEGDAGLLVVESLASVPEGERDAALHSLAASFQKTLSLTEGPVARAALIDLGGGRPPHLLLAVHHLCVDIVSWGVLLDGLCDACSQASRGEEVRLASKTTAFGAWAGRL
ncbi:MAG: non-ribosomal peptide synthetase, partial [Acidobacteria bacterium]